mmetsp:Transcript_60417/g.138582  ORF Transcript_60417/g.138582 Transcript_60417/m.138582 type:complete len:230 (+) Transcript_60417:548-1237(+)
MLKRPHSLILPSRPPLAKSSVGSIATSAHTQSSCALNCVCAREPCARFQYLMERSREPEMSLCVPTAAKHDTQSRCAEEMVRRQSSVAMSHNRIVWSLEPEARVGGSLQTARAKTPAACPHSERTHLSDAMFHTLTLESSDAEKRSSLWTHSVWMSCLCPDSEQSCACEWVSHTRTERSCEPLKSSAPPPETASALTKPACAERVLSCRSSSTKPCRSEGRDHARTEWS